MSSIISGIGRVAGALGKGLFAGAAGTAAITISQMIEMSIENRKQSTVPAEVASKVFGVEPINEEEKMKLTQEVHWAYGTSWGAFRGLLGAASVKGWPATATHFAAIFGAATAIQTELAGAPPVNKWNTKTIISSGIHHAVYAIAAGLVFDAIDRKI